MMSTNTMSGWWSAIFASASKPSIAVKTSHPSLARRVSAVRRIVLLSSITRTLRPWSFVLLPVTVRQLLQLDLRLRSPLRSGRASGGPETTRKATCFAIDPLRLRNEAVRFFNISAHPPPCCPRHVLGKSRAGAGHNAAILASFPHAEARPPRGRDGPHRRHPLCQGLDARHAARGAGARLGAA